MQNALVADNVPRAFAGEITDVEWSIGGLVTFTYFTPGQNNIITCVLYNAAGKPIGSGQGYPTAGVARIQVLFPNKYVGRQDLKVNCE